MIHTINPATEEKIASYQEDTNATLAEKYKKAMQAQHSWALVPVEARIQTVTRFRDLVVQNKEELAKILCREMGKPVKQAMNELNGLIPRIDFFLANVSKYISPEVVHEEAGLKEEIHYEPLGVIANISAWNYPYFVGSNVFIPAILTGNSVLYKPSEFVLETGVAIERLFKEAGLPDGVFQTIIGGGAVGASLLDLNIQGLFFTGSVSTGKKIAQHLAGRLIKLQMELGGKDPAYVAEDVDVSQAVEALSDGAMYNNGQSCCSVERIYVNEKIYDKFVDQFVKATQGFVVGDPTDEKTYIGPLAREAQISVLDEQVKDAISKGASLKLGGKKREGKGFYYEPTILTNVNHSMKVMQDESFGPIIGIQKVKDDSEALELMNDTSFGLTAAVYTTDESRARKMLSQLDAGSAYWNACDRVSPRLPWTGRKDSGIGSTLSYLGIRAFVQPKAYHLRG